VVLPRRQPPRARRSTKGKPKNKELRGSGFSRTRRQPNVCLFGAWRWESVVLPKRRPPRARRSTKGKPKNKELRASGFSRTRRQPNVCLFGAWRWESVVLPKRRPPRARRSTKAHCPLRTQFSKINPRLRGLLRGIRGNHVTMEMGSGEGPLLERFGRRYLNSGCPNCGAQFRMGREGHM
jgi:hypothetical protein